jgi:hypothetical protein
MKARRTHTLAMLLLLWFVGKPGLIAIVSVRCRREKVPMG